VTTPKPELGRQIATTGDGIDITRGFTGPLLTPYDSVLRNRGGHDLVIYEQVLSDPEVKATFGQRQLAVTQCEWQVDAGGDKRIDRQAAEFLRGELNAIGWDNVTTKMLYGVFYGYAVAEIVYAPKGGRIGMQAVKVRNRRRFRYTPEGELRLLTPTSMTAGIPAEAPYFWQFQTGADNDDEPYGLGLAHWLYWPVLFKRNGLKFWLIFLEKFGMPTAVGKYDPDASDAERAQLLAATRAIQTDSGIICPKGMDLELIEAARSGTVDYKTLHDAMDATIQKVVMGQTASTQGTSGRLGNDDLQAEVRSDIIKADADLVCESFNTGPARWLTEWNFPGAALPRVYRVTAESEDLNTLAERDERIARIGFRPTLARIEETYGEGYEPASPIGAAPGLGDPPAAFAAALPTPDYLDVLAAQMADRAGGAVEDWIARIRAEFAAATGYDDLLGRLSVLLTDLPLDALGETLASGFATAALAGQGDALDDSRA
jgi:phage gp29-like protein